MILLGLGSNMGDREDNLSRVLHLLESNGSVRIEKVSSIYETTPFGLKDQPDFLNMVISINTSLSPKELLDLCQKVENSLGRTRTLRWGPRVIDIDILLFDDARIENDTLTLPHPGIADRAFVLIPLAEVAPDYQFENGTRVDKLIENLPASVIAEVRLWKSIDCNFYKKSSV